MTNVSIIVSQGAGDAVAAKVTISRDTVSAEAFVPSFEAIVFSEVSGIKFVSIPQTDGKTSIKSAYDTIDIALA